MEDRDFRMGDKVTCIYYGFGVVTGVVTSDDSLDIYYPITVNFDSGMMKLYTRDGFGTDDNILKNQNIRCLYHGHNIEVEVKGEEIPKRVEKLQDRQFEKELASLLNEFGLENKCDVPDYILAEMIINFIHAVGGPIKKTLAWHGLEEPLKKVLSEGQLAKNFREKE